MRASGSACCRRRPAWPCCDGFFSPRSPLSPAALAIACASSNTTTPSKSRPSQSTICCTRLLLAFRLRAQGRVGREQDAFGESDRGALLEARQRHEVGAVAAERGPVALGILDQLVGFRDPQRAAAALEPVVEDDRGDLAALAGAGAVAEKPAAPEAHRVLPHRRARRRPGPRSRRPCRTRRDGRHALRRHRRRFRAARRTGGRPRQGAAAGCGL